MKLLTTAQQREQDDRFNRLMETVGVSLENNGLLVERIAELELSLEDKDFYKLSDLEDSKNFSRSALRRINYLARLYWLKNPLIKRAVNTQTQYVFGQGMNVQADDDVINEVVQKFIDNPKNRVELTDHQSRMVKESELQLFGNIFFVMFVNRFNGAVRIRTIPVDEISEIICDPDDSKTPLYYKRVFKSASRNLYGREVSATEKTVFYRDWKNVDTAINLTNVEQEAFIYHVSVNRLSDMKFGVSEVYAAIDWSKAYKEFLEDWATIAKALSRFAWRAKTKGGKRGLQAQKDKFKTSLGPDAGQENNPAPATGSILFQPENTSMEPIKTSGVTMRAEDGNKIINMVSAATGIFYHYLTGDPSTGNLATAKSMEKPMEIMFRDRQQLWTSIYTEILNFVVKQSIITPQGKLRNMATIEIDEYGEEIINWADDVDTNIHVTFPDLLEKDISGLISSIISAATLDGKAPAGTIDLKTVTRMLLEALGEEDIDEIIDKIPEPSAGEGAMAEAIKELKGVLVKYNGHA